jgi:hypothetical protein
MREEKLEAWTTKSKERNENAKRELGEKVEDCNKRGGKMVSEKKFVTTTKQARRKKTSAKENLIGGDSEIELASAKREREDKLTRWPVGDNKIRYS